MKSSDLMLQLLALPLEQKETFQVVLGHSIKMEQHADKFIQAELNEADKLSVTMLGLPSTNGAGRPIQPDSCFSLVKDKVPQGGEIPQEELLVFLEEKRGWDRKKASLNLNSNKIRLKRHGIQSRGHGKEAVWFAPTSNN